MSDFPPTADFFAPHVAASAYRGESWVSSSVDRPAADPPNNACGPVPPPAKASSQHAQDATVNWRAKYEAALALLEERRTELDELRAHHRRVVDHWVDLYTQERERNSPPF